jgi:hypothetical protein
MPDAARDHQRVSAVLCAANPAWHDLWMDKVEASVVAEGVLAELRREPYESLVQRIGHPEGRTLQGQSGSVYQVELEAFRDDGKTGNLRVAVFVDDGALSAFVKPLTRDFIIAPDGSFIGEA